MTHKSTVFVQGCVWFVPDMCRMNIQKSPKIILINVIFFSVSVCVGSK